MTGGLGGGLGGGPDSGGAAPIPLMTLRVNGEARSVAAGLTLDRLVATLTTARSGVAAAVNETVVPRADWAATRLRDGDRVEVLTAVQGG